MAYIMAGLGLAGLFVGKALGALTYLDDTVDFDSVSYSDFYKHAKTGDLLLFSSTYVTSMTRMWTHSQWSHVGMVYRAPNDNRIYEWSAHNSNEEILNSKGSSCGGPQLVPLENVVAESGCVYWKPLALSAHQRDTVADIIKLYAYKIGFSSNVEFLSYVCKPLSKVFAGYGSGMACPHIVAATLQAMDAIEIDRNISLYIPEHFSDTGDVKWKVGTERTKMVVGYDINSLIRLSPTKNITAFQ